MKEVFKRNRLGKEQFKTHYCLECNQQKSCGQLDEEKKYCCACYGREILEELEKEGLLVSYAQQTLNDYRSGKVICQCSEAEKPRIKHVSSDGSGWIKCERKKCKSLINSAGHHGIIKNRNDPKFWGLKVKEKVLCGKCLESKKGEMKSLKRAEFNRYRRLRRL